MRTTLVRGAAALTGSAVALSLALVAPSATAAPIPAPVGADPAPAVAAATYLAAQPGTDNIVTSYYDFPVGPPFESSTDYGLTIDVATALDAVGGQGAKLAAMTTALEANIGSYAFGGGSKAKLSSFLLGQGRTSTAVTDLVTDLRTNHISVTAPTAGRLVDADPNDFNTPLTQAFAASALFRGAPASAQAGTSLSFLLAQQCAAGFFRASFSAKAAPDQTCDAAATKTPSVDTTGLALVLLQDQRSAPAVAAAITKGLDWLVSQQAANGSFSSGNANATGLAGWALGVSGRTAAAEKAAGWLRAHQLANAGSCTPYAAANNGAVTLDDLGYADAATGPLDQIENSTATRATAQAAPALLWAAGGAAAGATTVSGPEGFVRAGSEQTVTLKGAPGNTLCVTKGGTASRVVLDAAGAASVKVTMPATTGDVVVSTVDAGGEADSVTLRGLAKEKLSVTLPKSKVAKGASVKVKVTGLAAGEKVTVTLGGKKATAVANGRGKAKVSLKATKTGTFKVKAVGGLKVRKGKATLTVTA